MAEIDERSYQTRAMAIDERWRTNVIEIGVILGSAIMTAEEKIDFLKKKVEKLLKS